jgi:hypothetical protein
MTSNRAAFFPTVLRNDLFRRDGILFGFEFVRHLPVHWAVVDPGRHAMYVWQKVHRSYPRSALDLGASLFTNGPFTNYGDGDLVRSTTSFVADLLPLLYRRGGNPSGPGFGSHVREMSIRHFQAPAPLGFVLGSREGIHETTISRPNIFYFGRRGFEFDDYRINRGDPSDESEAIGGLFGGVRDYEPYTVNHLNRVGYWCLAPLTDDPLLVRQGVGPALSSYETATGVPCRGLLMAVAGWANTQCLSHLLSAIRVRDAAQIDGGDSLLMGSGRTLRQGALMPEWKRLLQRWGVEFRPRDEPSG